MLNKLFHRTTRNCARSSAAQFLPFFTGWLICVSLLAGCASSPREITPTISALPPVASPTSITLTPAHTATPTKSRPTPTSKRTVSSPSPTNTPTPTEPALPAGAPFQVISPAHGSQLISPAPIELLIDPTAGQVLRLELYGQDGRLRTRQLLRTASLPPLVSLYQSALDFEIPSNEEPARFVFHMVDEYGRPVHIVSVDVTLLSDGSAEVLQFEQPQPAIVILQPWAGDKGSENASPGKSDGGLPVSGISMLDANKPIKLQLITQEGKIIGQRVTGITEPFSSGYGTFSTLVPYRVSEPTAVRLIAFQDGDPFSEISFLTSTLVVLQP